MSGVSSSHRVRTRLDRRAAQTVHMGVMNSNHGLRQSSRQRSSLSFLFLLLALVLSCVAWHSGMAQPPAGALQPAAAGAAQASPAGTAAPAAPRPPRIPLPVPANPKLPTLFLVGDSTVRNGQGDGAGGQWGWGEPLVDDFDTTKINVVNRAIGGLSSRT